MSDNIIIFGAGASFDACIPQMSGNSLIKQT